MVLGFSPETGAETLKLELAEPSDWKPVELPSVELKPGAIARPETQQLISDMIATMYATKGVGLAAVQIGKLLQLCVIVKEYNPLGKDDLCLINPSWTKLTRGQQWDEEGCLSVPICCNRCGWVFHR